MTPGVLSALVCTILMGGQSELPIGESLEPDQLTQLSFFELELLRGEVYAVHGYTFKSHWIRDFFLSQPWYIPCKPGERDPGDPEPAISMAEVRRIRMLLDAMIRLRPDLRGCWPVPDPDTLEYSYCSEVSFDPIGDPGLPDGYLEHSPLGDEIPGGFHPSFELYDLLPDDPFATIYERPDSVLAYIDDLPHAAQTEIAATVNEALSLYGLRMEDTVYRLYFSDSSEVVCVEAVTLGSGSWRSMIDPYLSWRLHFTEEGVPCLFEPLGSGRGWGSSVASVAFTPDSDSLRVRAAIYGDIRSIRMIVLEGPYRELPLEFSIYDMTRDGAERYADLTGRM